MVPAFYNQDTEFLPERKRRHEFSVGWRNYLNPGEPWRRIDPAIQSDLSVTAFPGNVQFPTSSQGWTDMLFDGAFSVRRWIDEHNGNNAEPEFGLRLAVETQHNVSGHIDESRPFQVGNLKSAPYIEMAETHVSLVWKDKTYKVSRQCDEFIRALHEIGIA
jgi:hypothetical protein